MIESALVNLQVKPTTHIRAPQGSCGGVVTGRGRKPSISDEKVAEIVDLTLHSKPEGQMHWSCRSMAKRAGVSSASVQRIWSARGLKTHLVKTFTLSHDRHFEKSSSTWWVLYRNPPD